MKQDTEMTVLTWADAFSLIFEKGTIKEEIEIASGRMYRLNVGGRDVTVFHAAAGESAMMVN